ncbi:MAG: hypothetical protein ABR581_09060 [Thermoleophilaceae bacterium]
MVAAATGAVLTPSAGANSRQQSIIQDDALILNSGPGARQRTLDEFHALGDEIVKVQVRWRDVTPGGNSRPAGFDARSPSSYNWSAVDGFVRDAVARGLRPFISLGGSAPGWASSGTNRHPGTHRPSSSEFESFVFAAGQHFSGSAGVPRVTLWSAWNEPNLTSWLSPQRNRRRIPLSPTLYRRLYLAFYRGLRDSGHAADTLLLGELMPLGGRSRKRVPPLAFLRELFCLNRRYHRYRGRAARARGCPRRVGRIPTSGLAYHPYTARGGPTARTRQRDDAPISELGRLRKVLDALARRHKLRRRLPIWITEYGFQTNPPDPFQYPIRRVPGFMDRSEWIAFRNPRVRSYSQYTLVDDPPAGGSIFRRWSNFQQGLRFAHGTPKPGVYAAYRLPAFVRLRGRGHVQVFGGLRAGAGGQLAVIEARRRHGHFHRIGSARLNSRGYFRKLLRVRAAGKRTYKIKIGGLARIKRPAKR